MAISRGEASAGCSPSGDMPRLLGTPRPTGSSSEEDPHVSDETVCSNGSGWMSASYRRNTGQSATISCQTPAPFAPGVRLPLVSIGRCSLSGTDNVSIGRDTGGLTDRESARQSRSTIDIRTSRRASGGTRRPPV